MNKVLTNLLILSLISCTFAATKKVEQKKSDTLKHVLAVYNGVKHQPFDYPGGPEISKKKEDENIKITWPGITTAWQLGKHFSSIYGPLFDVKTWTSNDYSLSASGANWVKHSDLVIAAGLRDDNKGKKDTWTPEEMKTVTDKTQYGYFFDKNNCPKFFESVEKAKTKLSSELEKLKKKKEFKESPMSDTEITIWQGYETSQMMTSPPKWFEKLRDDLKQFSQKLFFNAFEDTQTKKLSGGPILTDILNQLESAFKGTKKVTLLSLPRIVFAALLSVLNPSGTRYDDKALDSVALFPDEGAKLLIELHETQKKEKKIKVTYTYSEAKSAVELVFPQCNEGTLCGYEHVKTLLKDFSSVTEQQQKDLCKK